jgi:hypothetical protein
LAASSTSQTAADSTATARLIHTIHDHRLRNLPMAGDSSSLATAKAGSATKNRK